MWYLDARAVAEAMPSLDDQVLLAERALLAVEDGGQVAGKVRDRLTVPVGLSEAKALAVALGSQRGRAAFDGKPSKVVYVPNRLINLVP